MTRTTKKDLMQIQNVINNELKGQKKLERVSVEWAYGQPRAYLRWASDGELVGPLSPRLRTGHMLLWLYAFETGLRTGYYP